MELSYESIFKKLGFDPKDYKPHCPGYEDDSVPSPFSVLTMEELDFISDYIYSLDSKGASS